MQTPSYTPIAALTYCIGQYVTKLIRSVITDKNTVNIKC